jgi:hypothetical protein
MTINTIYNNEAIAAVAIGYFMQGHTKIEHAKALFVLPFVLHDPTANRLRSRSYKRSLEEFIVSNVDCVINFNDRFIEYLPLTINAITILEAINVIKIDKHYLHFNNTNLVFNPQYDSSLGDRAKKVMKAVDGLREIMFLEDTSSFYLKLKVLL